MKKKELTPIVADENIQIENMLRKAMKGVKEALKSLFGSYSKPIYRVLIILVLMIIVFMVISAIIQQFL